jgi:ATP-binding cassette subfamily B protein
MDMQDVNKFSIPTLTKIITADVETVSSFYVALFTSGLMLPLTLIILAPIMASKSMAMIVIIAIIMVVCFVLVYITFRHIDPFVEKSGEGDIEINNKIVEYMEGATIIRAYGGEEKHYSDFKDISDDLSATNRKVKKNMSYMGPMMDSMVVVLPLTIYAIAYFIMPGLDSDQQIDTLASIISFTMYALMILSAVTQSTYVMASAYPSFVSSREAVESVIDFEPAMRNGDKENPDRSGTVELRDVSFQYPGQNEPLLKNINISIKKGEKIAIMGPSASGKSSLLNLMMRFYDATTGTVLVDGMDVRDYDLMDLRGRISFYPQEPVIFSASAFENIKFGQVGQNISDEEVLKIMEECEVTDFIEELPNGKDTILKENGKGLSGGQRQRIGLARTMCTPGEIYILDTPFSRVDAKMESRIMDALKKRMRDRTIIMVTHKITAARTCDRIYILENGEITGCGTHEELMKTCEYYSQMVQLQMDWEALS